jgi:hypothetical protein
VSAECIDKTDRGIIVSPEKTPKKMFLINAFVYIAVGPFGILSSLHGAQHAHSIGMPVTAFYIGMTGAVLVFLMGIVMLIWLWPKITIKD